jgi:hypothetical protein
MMDTKNGRVEDFEAFLSKLGTVPEDKIKFYIHWVRRLRKKPSEIKSPLDVL